MPEAPKLNQKGIVLLIVLTTILVVVILGNIVLRLMLNQSRLSHHQASRIQAYYADMAGVNLAMERLRTGDWTPAVSGATNTYCINGSVDGTACLETIDDPQIAPRPGNTPYYHVQITVHPLGSGIDGTTRIDVKTDYTASTPP